VVFAAVAGLLTGSVLVPQLVLAPAGFVDDDVAAVLRQHWILQRDGLVLGELRHMPGESVMNTELVAELDIVRHS
jgi:hypothetical protein